MGRCVADLSAAADPAAAGDRAGRSAGTVLKQYLDKLNVPPDDPRLRPRPRRRRRRAGADEPNLPPVTRSRRPCRRHPPRRRRRYRGGAAPGRRSAARRGRRRRCPTRSPAPTRDPAASPDAAGGHRRQGARVRHRGLCRGRGRGVVAGQAQGPPQARRSRSRNAATPTRTWTTNPSPNLTPRRRRAAPHRDAVASERGAGPMGFAGTADEGATTEQAAGLTELRRRLVRRRTDRPDAAGRLGSRGGITRAEHDRQTDTSTTERFERKCHEPA